MKRNDIALVALAITVFIGSHAAVDALDRHEAQKAAESSPVYVVEVKKPVEMPSPVVPKANAVMAVAEIATPTTISETETVATEPEPVATYPVPLDEKLQLFIIEQAEAHGIDPVVVFCMIYQESSFDASKIGDGGEAFGLMQVWPKWHSDRMKKLGCEDLLDPYQNVTVGVDYYAECLGKYDGDHAKALTAYNQGSFKGVVNEHARAVLAKIEAMEAGCENALLP